MARKYGRVSIDIWADPDFRALTRDAQLLYIALISQPTISNCGVLPITLRRWAGYTDWTADTVEAALDELAANRFVVVDWDTEEVLVRSFMRHDGGVDIPNVRKAMDTAVDKVVSPRLRSIARHEFRRATGETPGHDPSPPDGEPSANRSTNPSGTVHGTQARSSDSDSDIDLPPHLPVSSRSNPPDDPRREQVITAHIRRQADNTTQPIRNRPRWERTVRHTFLEQHGPELDRLLAITAPTTPTTSLLHAVTTGDTRNLRDHLTTNQPDGPDATIIPLPGASA